jgi:hypothetical protein
MITKIMLYAMSVASRGFKNTKTDIPTKQLRYISCYGNGIPDIGAMGTLFPELFVIGLLLFVFAIVIGPKNESTWKWLLGIVVLIGSFFINQEAWVLRYIPHIWLLLVLFLDQKY